MGLMSQVKHICFMPMYGYSKLRNVLCSLPRLRRVVAAYTDERTVAEIVLIDLRLHKAFM